MDSSPFPIEGPVLIKPRVFADSRGSFSETYKQSALRELLGDVAFVQDNQSVSAMPGTVRGLHYQSPPHAQGKLVRCAKGAIVDVAVDVRVGSPTFGENVRVELSDANAHQLWVPPGFLHGFATLTPDTIVMYKVTDIYAPQCDGAVMWNDPDLAIDWGIDPDAAVLSDKDAAALAFADWTSPFKFEDSQ